MKYIKIFEADSSDWVTNVAMQNSFFKDDESLTNYFQDYIDDGFKIKLEQRYLINENTGSRIFSKLDFNKAYNRLIVTVIRLYAGTRKIRFSSQLNSSEMHSNIKQYKNLLDFIPKIDDKLSFDFEKYDITLEGNMQPTFTIRVEVMERLNDNIKVGVLKNKAKKDRDFTKMLLKEPRKDYTLQDAKRIVDELGYRSIFRSDNLLEIEVADKRLENILLSLRLDFKQDNDKFRVSKS